MMPEKEAHITKDVLELKENAPGLILENERVRVLSAVIPAGETAAMHSHPDHVLYIQKGGKVRLIHSSGKEETIDLRSGETRFMDAQTHEVTNLSGSAIEMVVIELK